MGISPSQYRYVHFEHSLDTVIAKDVSIACQINSCVYLVIILIVKLMMKINFANMLRILIISIPYYTL